MYDFDQHVRAILETYGFEYVPFDDLRSRLTSRSYSPEQNRISGVVEHVDPASITPYPDIVEPARERWESLGRDAIDGGQVGVVVLNGGMATRFGGTAKGVVPAYSGRSFLDLKIAQVSRVGGGAASVYLMNSFATDRPTREHLDGIETMCEVKSFSQFVSLRLTREGELFKEDGGGLSLYAPGHGDLPFALSSSGILDRFLASGGRYLTLSNVDNLGAGLDPVIVGMHIDSRRPISVELVETNPGDVGGFPACFDGKTAIAEAFRLPGTFDMTTIPLFNTNTFVFDAAVLADLPRLDWFTVEKRVEDRPVIQFERLVGQMTEHHSTNWIKVRRDGDGSRFLPVKVPADLGRMADRIEAVLSRQGVL